MTIEIIAKTIEMHCNDIVIALLKDRRQPGFRGHYMPGLSIVLLSLCLECFGQTTNADWPNYGGLMKAACGIRRSSKSPEKM